VLTELPVATVKVLVTVYLLGITALIAWRCPSSDALGQSVC
jgi:hypothetical protein